MIKKIIPVFCFLIITATASAQTPYQTVIDTKHPENKVLKGMISKEVLQHDSAYKWYAESQKIYMHPDTAIVNALKKNKDSVSYIIFGGTWCEDTQFILPKFFVLQEKAGIADNKITLFAVDRAKETTGNIASAFKIINVPTIIIMKDGKEAGRVVEYGKTGMWDKELAGMLK